MSTEIPDSPLSKPDIGDVPCPLCRYNLRGITSNRCPECGWEFDPERVAAGEARADVPNAVDKGDLRLPHVYLFAPLAVLAEYVRHPSRVVLRVELRGSLWRGLLACVGGLLWVAGGFVVLMACAISVHTRVSPFVAAKAAVLLWAPAMLSFVLAAALCGIDLSRQTMRQLNLRSRRFRMRIELHWIPVQTAWFAWVFAVIMLLNPEIRVLAITAGMLAAAIPYYTSWWALLRSTIRTKAPRRRSLLVVWGVAPLLIAAVVRIMYLPPLEPPLWLFRIP
jgi:hypothetical protein